MQKTKEIKLTSIAESFEDQSMGLMFVKSLPKETGMLFKYQSPKILSFWMQNTYIPLDIAFINEENKIEKIESMIPLSTRAVRSEKPCIMALEVLSGTLKSSGIKVGDKITLDVKNKMVKFE